ncbi:IS5 family transposase [Streptomyces sp. NBC_01294]|nr:IS5 family transposase [Streptomyces sp. NBC_01294]WRZ61722.1 IS5 family transposase [Streptomyces sp. NBC_01294]WRZ62003.1 IS5 family transposase [Streptomyces sp. NBC_01294]
MRRHELTNAQWERIAPLLPETGGPGGRWADHRTVVNGVLYRTRTGIPWRDLPERYGSWQTVYERHRRWSADGTWSNILRALQAGADSTARDADGSWAVNADSTTCRAHQHAAGARHSAPAPPRKRGGTRVDAEGREALGRSRGGLTSKVHLLADDRCRPLVWLTSPGQRGDSPMFIPLMQVLNVARTGAGRPRTRPDRARGDKAYSSRANRVYLRKRGIKATIAQPDDQRANRRRRGRAGGRPPSFDREQYRRRNTVERCIGKLKQHRAVATRYDKRDYIFNGTLATAAIVIWLRDLIKEPSDTA